MAKRSKGRRIIDCLRCENTKIHEARGLCKCCYNHLAEGRCRATESLDQYPPLGGYGQHSSAHTTRSRPSHDPGHITLREARQDYRTKAA